MSDVPAAVTNELYFDVTETINSCLLGKYLLRRALLYSSLQ
jgi:hypothetical protein